MIVEFTGSTSSGKTHLLNYVLKASKRSETGLYHAYDYVLERYFNIRLQGRIRSAVVDMCLFPWIPWGLKKHGSYVRNCIRIILKRRDRYLKRLNIIRNFIKKLLLYEYLCMKCHPEVAVLIDEGPLHLLNNVFAHHDDDPDLEKLKTLLKYLPIPELVVYIYAPESVVAERALHRIDPSRNNLSREQWTRLAVNTRKIYEVFEESKLDPPMTLKINNADMSAHIEKENATKIIEFICLHVQQSG